MLSTGGAWSTDGLLTDRIRWSSETLKVKFHYASWFGAEIWPIV